MVSFTAAKHILSKQHMTQDSFVNERNQLMQFRQSPPVVSPDLFTSTLASEQPSSHALVVTTSPRRAPTPRQTEDLYSSWISRRKQLVHELDNHGKE
jgi:hypothetical protein